MPDVIFKQTIKLKAKQKAIDLKEKCKAFDLRI